MTPLQEVSAKTRRIAKPTLRGELSILLVLVVIAAIFEILGWIFVGESFLANPQRLLIIVLQVSVTGIIAVGMTQVIITAGIDLSPGSVVGLTAMIAASLAQTTDSINPVYPSLLNLWAGWPVLAGIVAGLLAGAINGVLIAKTKVPPFIATLGMMVAARGLAQLYTNGEPIALLSPQFTWFGSSLSIGGLALPMPVLIFLMVAVLGHIALRYTRYGKFTYAIGANPQAARVSGINIDRHLIKVYAIAGLLSGLAGVVTAARAASAQATMGDGYELDAIAAAVIGGTSLAGGVGRIGGTVIGTIILGVITSGFTFLKVGSYYQAVIKGVIIVLAVVVDQYRRSRLAKG